ncbi:MAG: alpha/beta hydrolase [Treponema sp.]|nr:alpha/beta hydrolase [Treponema sp.]
MKEEVFSCKRDKLTIRGLLFRPESKAKKLPLAIISHGFMADYNSTKDYAKAFAEMGFLSIVFDFSGGSMHSQSDGDTSQMSLLTETEDLKAVIQAALLLPNVDKEDITLVGCSMGGFVSAMVAKESATQIKRIILFYPAFCMPDDARRGQMIQAKFNPQNIPDSIYCGEMKLGKIFVDDIINLNPFEEIKNYKGQVLLIHGSSDDLVLPEYSKKAYKAYFQARGQKPDKDLQLLLIDNANHGFWGPQSNEWNKLAFFAIKNFIEGKEELLTVDVILTECQESLDGDKKISKLFFKGQAQSPYFTGIVESPAYDQQIHIGSKTISCCADYKLIGKDYTGQECYVKVKNQLIGREDKVEDFNLDWKPTVSTNSKAFSKLNTLDCQTYAEMRPQGPMIHIWG